MRVTRRAFVQSSAAGIALLGNRSVSPVSSHGRGSGMGDPVPPSIAALKPLPNPAPPITPDERRARIAKAQRLMSDQGIGAIVLEDCLYMTPEGPKFFTQPSPSIDQPFA